MDFNRLATQRRSTRKYDGRQVPQEFIDEIIATTLTAPSSKNCRSTRIAYTEDRRVLELVADMRSTGTSFVREAPLAFFVLANDSNTDLWRENCSISATVLQFAAEDLGLASCWVHVDGRPHRNEEPDGMSAGEYLKRHIPELEPYRILCVVACGYPVERHKPHMAKPGDEAMSFRIAR